MAEIYWCDRLQLGAKVVAVSGAARRIGPRLRVFSLDRVSISRWAPIATEHGCSRWNLCGCCTAPGIAIGVDVIERLVSGAGHSIRFRTFSPDTGLAR